MEKNINANYGIKGIKPQGKPCTKHSHLKVAMLGAASRGVLNPSFPHSLDHVRASTDAISLHSSINYDNKIFTNLENTENGEVNNDTLLDDEARVV